MKPLVTWLIESEVPLYIWMTAFMALLLGSLADLPVAWLAYIVLCPVLIAIIVAVLSPIARIADRR